MVTERKKLSWPLYNPIAAGEKIACSMMCGEDAEFVYVPTGQCLCVGCKMINDEIIRSWKRKEAGE